jgi:hypothetical protein
MLDLNDVRRPLTAQRPALETVGQLSRVVKFQAEPHRERRRITPLSHPVVIVPRLNTHRCIAVDRLAFNIALLNVLGVEISPHARTARQCHSELFDHREGTRF